MKEISLAGMVYEVESPSLLHLKGFPISLGYNGEAWFIYIDENWQQRKFQNREEVTHIVSDAFAKAGGHL